MQSLVWESGQLCLPLNQITVYCGFVEFAKGTNIGWRVGCSRKSGDLREMGPKSIAISQFLTVSQIWRPNCIIPSCTVSFGARKAKLIKKRTEPQVVIYLNNCIAITPSVYCWYWGIGNPRSYCICILFDLILTSQMLFPSIYDRWRYLLKDWLNSATHAHRILSSDSFTV